MRTSVDDTAWPAPGRTGFLFFEGHAPFRRARAQPVRKIPAGSSLSDETLSTDERAFFAQLFRMAGLDARGYRDRALARRLPACFRALGVSTVAQASARLIARPDLVQATLESVLLGVTEFFRDPPVFRFLDTEVLPQLLSSVARPRIWSAACSDGQELYSVALLLEKRGGLSKCELLGTDCRAAAVERARQGLYPADDSIQTWPELAGRSQMPADLCGSLTWKQADLLEAAEPGPWHLLLCRNVSIYLEAAAAEALWRSLAAVLAPGGYLVVGKADYPTRHLPLQRVAVGVYRKVLP